MKPTWTHHFIALHVSIMLFLFHFIDVLCVSLLFLFLLCYSSPCFTVPLRASLHYSSLCFIASHVLMFFKLCCCSSCFIATPWFITPTSLLFIVLCCCSLCFVITLASLLFYVLLLLLLCCCVVLCCSYYFVIAWCFTSPLCFTILLPS